MHALRSNELITEELRDRYAIAALWERVDGLWALMEIRLSVDAADAPRVVPTERFLNSPQPATHAAPAEIGRARWQRWAAAVDAAVLPAPHAAGYVPIDLMGQALLSAPAAQAAAEARDADVCCVVVQLHDTTRAR